MNKVFLILVTLFFSLISLVANAQNKVIFGGFSFGSILPKDTITNSILKENGGMLFINKLLVEKTKEISNESFLVDFNLLKDEASEENQNVIVLALDNEYINDVSIPGDNLTRTDIILNFQIIFFNAKNNFLTASIPLEISKNFSSVEKLNNSQIKSELKRMYENEVLKYYYELLNNFTLKSKFKNRIGITEVNFEDNAKKNFKKYLNEKDIFLKNKFAKSLSSFIAFNNDIAIVPYGQDRTTNTLMLRFENTQREIKLPNPDFHMHLTIRGFKNVLFKEGNIDEQWIYGSYTNIKIMQPDLDENQKVKMDEKFKHGLNIEMSKRSMENKESFEWIFFNDSLKMLFDNFSKQTVEIDKKWLKSANDNKKIKKLFEDLKSIYDSCK
tara:strand:- start:1540 stop:2694 length:1155 start_codon:yes stop_codon:yes gene_type:complete